MVENVFNLNYVLSPNINLNLIHYQNSRKLLTTINLIVSIFSNQPNSNKLYDIKIIFWLQGSQFITYRIVEHRKLHHMKVEERRNHFKTSTHTS